MHLIVSISLVAPGILILSSKLVVLMLFGYRTQAIRILGREVMEPRGLIGLGFDSVDYCGPEIATVSRQDNLCVPGH